MFYIWVALGILAYLLIAVGFAYFCGRFGDHVASPLAIIWPLLALHYLITFIIYPIFIAMRLFEKIGNLGSRHRK